jgi:hypothetical protein
MGFMNLSKEDLECVGCYQRSYTTMYGNCEGCVALLSYQQKTFDILKKSFKVEGKEVKIQDGELTDKEREFLLKLLTYLDNGE